MLKDVVIHFDVSICARGTQESSPCFHRAQKPPDSFHRLGASDHDPTPFPFLEEEDNFSEEGSV